MSATPWIVAVGLAAAALHVGSAAAAGHARRRGLVWIAGVALAAVVSEWLGPPTEPAMRAVVVGDLLIAWLAVGFAAVATHAAKTLGRGLVLVAVALAGAASGAPGMICALGITVWLTRSFVGPGVRRRFDRVQTFAVAAVAAGVLAAAAGEEQIGAVVFLAAAVARAGVVPFQGWLSAFASSAPRAVSIAFLAPTLSFWPLLTEACPIASLGGAPVFASAALVVAAMAALGSMVQTDARQGLVWLWSGQSALVLFALVLEGASGRDAGVFLSVVFAVSMAGAWAVLGAVEARRGLLDLERGGAAGSSRAAAAFLVLGMAGIGMPATPGFVAEDLVLHASAGLGIWAGAGLLLASALQGIALLRVHFGVFAGPRPQPAEPDLVLRERICAGVALALLLLGGVWPAAFVGPPESAPAAAMDADH